MLTAVLIDDEKPARDRLRRLLEKDVGVHILGEASNGLEALDLIDTLKPAVIFLDIEMPEIDGIAVAEALLAASAPSRGQQAAVVPRIVFVTAYSEFALKAFEVNALDYLVKPVSEARLGTCLEKLKLFAAPKIEAATLRKISQEPITKFAVKVGAKHLVCATAQISAILASDHYAAILYQGKELLSTESLESLLERLDPQKFLRVHRSAVINLDYLKTLERQGDRKYLAHLNDAAQTRVPISREKLDEVKARIPQI